ncbi:MAG: hypothetical protein GY722_28025 [bacterium]|nr:hypothetical protein [bacterium]
MRSDLLVAPWNGKSRGTPTHPVILKAEGELTLVLTSLEAFWRWKFEPAKLDGEPVDVYYNLTINFKLRGHRD